MRKTPDDGAMIQRLYQEKAQELYFIARSIVQNETKAEEAVYTCFRKLTEDFALCCNQDSRIPFSRQSQVRVLRSRAEVYTGVPSPAQASSLREIKFLSTEVL